MARPKLRATGLLVGATVLVTLIAGAPAAAAATPATPPAAPRAQASAGTHIAAALNGWTQVSDTTEFTPTNNEGVATVNPPGGNPYQYYVGTLSVPADLAAESWTHIGDPDSSQGYIFNDFQYGGSNPTSKLFRVTTPSGAHYDYTHTLVSGEEMNNSWVAVSPDSQWMVNGEWDTMNRFLVFPTPILELVQRIAEHNPHLYQRDVENIVNAILDEIVAALARGDRVELRGFGAFSVKHRPARAGRNPRTGAHVPVDQKSVPFFKTGKEMRERLNRDHPDPGAPD